MNLNHVNFAKFGAELVKSDEVFSVRYATGDKVLLGRAAPDPTGFEADLVGMPKVAWAITQGLNASLALNADIARLRSSGDFTEAGLERKLEQPRDSALKTMSAVLTDYDKFTKDVAVREASRYKPPVDLQNPASESRDREIRQWVASMGTRYTDLFAAYEGNELPLLSAILRSPYPMGAPLTQMVATRYQKFIDEVSDPQGAAFLRNDKNMIDWAKNGIRSIKGRFLADLGYGADRLYHRAKELGSEKLFDFSPDNIVQFENRKRYAAKA